MKQVVSYTLRLIKLFISLNLPKILINLFYTHLVSIRRDVGKEREKCERDGG
jgi:hypothetical protein